jgi:hypothetical protein
MRRTNRGTKINSKLLIRTQPFHTFSSPKTALVSMQLLLAQMVYQGGKEWYMYFILCCFDAFFQTNLFSASAPIN